MNCNISDVYEPWLSWANEIQAIAQIILTYSDDKFEVEHLNRIREIAAEMISYKTEIPKGKVVDLFCNEIGYKTPKLGTRAAVFREELILLVKEDGKWALPGGWVDVDQTIYSNTVKEVKEEAGVDVRPLRIIAIQDRNKRNTPRHANEICNIFVLCEYIGGCFVENIETEDSNFFSLENLPEIDNSRSTFEQIDMCFQAYKQENWVVSFD